jgi:hypothetical protein
MRDDGERRSPNPNEDGQTAGAAQMASARQSSLVRQSIPPSSEQLCSPIGGQNKVCETCGGPPRVIGEAGNFLLGEFALHDPNTIRPWAVLEFPAYYKINLTLSI